MKLSIIILAAGQGTRMKSAMPKVLHEIGDKPLLEHVVNTAQQLDSHNILIVYGHGGEQVKDSLSHLDVHWVLQSEQLGTGHAVQQPMSSINDDEYVLILYGDVPLIRQATLEALINELDDKTLTLLTANLANPGGYGRIIRKEGLVQSIVEEKDASDEQRLISEINTGILAVKASLLRGWLDNLKNDNTQGEYYLTDIIAMAVKDNIIIKTTSPQDLFEIEGVNNKIQLAELERAYQYQQAQALMLQGVTFRDPHRFDLRGEVSVGQDVVIDVNVILEGNVELADGVKIGANTVIKNSSIGSNSEIHPNSMIEQSKLGSGCQIGPFARLRPDNNLSDRVKVGNFVELKKSTLGVGSKVNHLSYVGDTSMGENVNIGAGTITCNYDGANKHQTIIEDNVFIGSDTQLVAPVKVGEGATIGAGSTITHDTPAEQLTLSRSEQKSRKGWKRPVKSK